MGDRVHTDAQGWSRRNLTIDGHAYRIDMAPHLPGRVKMYNTDDSATECIGVGGKTEAMIVRPGPHEDAYVGKAAMHMPSAWRKDSGAESMEGKITYVDVVPSLRRKGLATEMVRFLKDAYPDVALHHETNAGMLTADGATFAKAVDITFP